MKNFIGVLLILFLLLSSCCRTHQLGLDFDPSLPLEIRKMTVDTSEIENRVIQVKKNEDVNPRFKKTILRKILNAKSVCFIIPGRSQPWISIESDTVE